MGNLADDTAVEEVGEGRYRATLSAEWEIWGPMGGYVAATALRAVGASSRFDRPASFACHYLGVAQFDQVDLEVTTMRSARTAESHRVTVTQEGRPILDAVVWSIGDVEGLQHDLTEAPLVPGPDLLRPEEELRTRITERPNYPFWDNFDMRSLSFHEDWPPPEPLPPVWRQWCRFRPVPTFDDPWLDACRSLILVDVQSWPAASGPHVTGEQRFIAPMLDLYVAFNDPRPSSQWLLTDGHGPLARDGLMAWDGRLWSEDGHLVASGTGQMLCRRMPSP